MSSPESPIDVGEGTRIHPTAVLGYCPAGEDPGVVKIGSNVTIGAFCVVETGAVLGDLVELSHHSVVGAYAHVGDRTVLVDKLRIDSRAKVGTDCVIGGNVPDRSVVGDHVTMMGEMAHSYSNASIPWATVDEVSPIVRDGAVVAQGSQVIGGIVVGAGAYIATGEVVRTDVEPGTMVANGRRVPLERLRGFVRARSS